MQLPLPQQHGDGRTRSRANVSEMHNRHGEHQNEVEDRSAAPGDAAE